MTDKRRWLDPIEVRFAVVVVVLVGLAVAGAIWLSQHEEADCEAKGGHTEVTLIGKVLSARCVIP